ncbi:MAG TPA: glycosyltransferase, partial [Chitinophagaceae bacterium]|nr:glycosyltransferase [Chitinophagaceae bacterium]
MKKVLYLSYTGMTDPLGQSQVLAYLKRLSQMGQYQFTVISFEKQEAYNRLHTAIEEFCKASGICWYPLSYTAKPPVLSTFRDVSRMRELAMRLARNQQYSIIHCRSYIASLVGLQVKKRIGIPFLFDMRGFWADERIDGAIWNKSNPVFNFIYKFFKRKEKQFLQMADQVVSLTYNAKMEIESWNLQPSPAPITVIPCCADFESFDPLKISEEQKRKAIESIGIPQDAVIFSYLGTLGTWYMIDEMMAFAREFQKKNPGSYFMVLTGEPESLVKDAAKKAGYDDRF